MKIAATNAKQSAEKELAKAQSDLEAEKATAKTAVDAAKENLEANKKAKMAAQKKFDDLKATVGGNSVAQLRAELTLQKQYLKKAEAKLANAQAKFEKFKKDAKKETDDLVAANGEEAKSVQDELDADLSARQDALDNVKASKQGVTNEIEACENANSVQQAKLQKESEAIADLKEDCQDAEGCQGR